MTTSNKIFVSYSHKDRKLFDEFKTRLMPAVRRELVDPSFPAAFSSGRSSFSAMKRDARKFWLTSSTATFGRGKVTGVGKRLLKQLLNN